ncbi:helix-turn-helix domain-containing protein [Chromobacterium sp. Beijing]|uniref:helix-turn-helix domain-containing protein n=1 Tax=Chromobacterium sp. Beijing TaxID=2735795 RepID=UPI001F3EF41B|nr:helix-turn-helix domain-containing protein [Chromobacterium sp. Beijing]UJB30125.1 helix-turn-helix domain-containing protein [Chromobacterium sp. Beijing]
MIAAARCFDDAHLHAEALPGWEQLYSQISGGRFRSTLSRVRTARLDIFRESFNQRVVQQGRAPGGMIHFALPIRAPSPLSLQGVAVPDDALMALRGGEDFVLHLPPGSDSVQVSVPYEDLAELTPALCRPLREARGKTPVFPVRPAALAALRALLNGVFEQALLDPALLSYAGNQKVIQHQLLSLLQDALADSALGERRGNLTFATHCDIVRRSQALALAKPDEPVTVLELCSRLRVSRRTLQNSFQLVADTTPVDYLRSIRLNAVRRMLLNPARPGHGVRDAAGAWGFYHLGHFAADYRKLFGEAPSHTRGRALAHLGAPPGARGLEPVNDPAN